MPHGGPQIPPAFGFFFVDPFFFFVPFFFFAIGQILSVVDGRDPRKTSSSI
jgi:hypothetical protein